ncbi:hypothetical protein SAMN03080614_100480 [Anaerobranca gottschalkii DSM 13577]|uniref:Uncharacterized protein n=1 Tax=Anaerobranca gottschalkii DSM 13577 TaxID=1120990 RepID=A0A1H9YQV7_9FIRM|nr:hypothetical protein SAMN03080614_100480 [Anaerobranca gottschalkii DSM 13577]
MNGIFQWFLLFMLLVSLISTSIQTIKTRKNDELTVARFLFLAVNLILIIMLVFNYYNAVLFGLIFLFSIIQLILLIFYVIRE